MTATLVCDVGEPRGKRDEVGDGPTGWDVDDPSSWQDDDAAPTDFEAGRNVAEGETVTTTAAWSPVSVSRTSSTSVPEIGRAHV